MQEHRHSNIHCGLELDPQARGRSLRGCHWPWWPRRGGTPRGRCRGQMAVHRSSENTRDDQHARFACAPPARGRSGALPTARHGQCTARPKLSPRPGGQGRRLSPRPTPEIQGTVLESYCSLFACSTASSWRSHSVLAWMSQGEVPGVAAYHCSDASMRLWPSPAE